MPTTRPHAVSARLLLVASCLLLTLALALGQAGSASAKLLQRLSAPPHVATARAAGATARPAASEPDLAPSDLHAAYSLPSIGAPGQTIAVITAYNDPTAESDLKHFLSEFKLAPCTTANHCFRKVNQSGKSSGLPRTDPTGGNWITEAALGTEIARGVCQSCSILLVEANGADNADLSTAVNTAARMGAQVIETSFSPPEQAGDTSTYAGDYNHAHSVVVAASGDSGDTGGVTFPAAFPNVIAVGGTHLKFDKYGDYAGESVWNSDTGASGSGCSLYTAAPSWQAAFARGVGCGSKRSVADLSAVAAPGALVYISNVQGQKGGGWYPAEGTSLSSPVIAGAIGLSGGGSAASAELLYQRSHTSPRDFRDIVSGATPGCGTSLCVAGKGYDGPTGLGTPRGLGAFFPAGGKLSRRHPFVSFRVAHGQLRVNRSWSAGLTLHSRNPFTIHGRVSLRSGRRTFATGSLTISPLGSRTVRLRISSRYRGLLASLRSVGVVATASLRGPQGGAVTISQRLILRAP